MADNETLRPHIKAASPSRRTATEQIGGPHLSHHDGMMAEERQPQLVGQRGVQTYRQMGDSQPAGTMLLALEAFFRSVPIEVKEEPVADDDPQADAKRAEAARYRDFLVECIHDMEHSWATHMAEAALQFKYGWAAFQPIFKVRAGPNQRDKRRRSKYRDGLLGWRKLMLHKHEGLWRWEIDEDGDVQGMWHRPSLSSAPVQIPSERLIHYRTTTAGGNPEGRSLLRHCWEEWERLRRDKDTESIGLERQFRGFPVITLPSSLLADAQGENPDPVAVAMVESYRAIAENLHYDEQGSLVMPAEEEADYAGQNVKTGYGFRFETPQNAGKVDISAVIDRREKRIASSTLANFILTGQDSVGSFALKKEETNLFAVIVEAFLDSTLATINQSAIPMLFHMNRHEFPDPDLIPHLAHPGVTMRDLTQLADFVAKGLQAGFITADERLEADMRAIAGLSPREGEEDHGAT